LSGSFKERACVVVCFRVKYLKSSTRAKHGLSRVLVGLSRVLVGLLIVIIIRYFLHCTATV